MVVLGDAPQRLTPLNGNFHQWAPLHRQQQSRLLRRRHHRSSHLIILSDRRCLAAHTRRGAGGTPARLREAPGRCRSASFSLRLVQESSAGRHDAEAGLRRTRPVAGSEPAGSRFSPRAAAESGTRAPRRGPSSGKWRPFHRRPAADGHSRRIELKESIGADLNLRAVLVGLIAMLRLTFSLSPRQL
jgi:hypothetical protein